MPQELSQLPEYRNLCSITGKSTPLLQHLSLSSHCFKTAAAATGTAVLLLLLLLLLLLVLLS
jgi:ribosomal protein S14